MQAKAEMENSRKEIPREAKVVEDTRLRLEIDGQDDVAANGQAGVQKAVLLRRSISKRALTIAYLALFLTLFANRFSVYSALTYTAYATSAFSEHSLLSAAGVVSDITQLCAYPIIAKLEDVIGRAEGFAFSVIFMAIASIMYAACPNIETYLVAGIFNAIGDTGLLLTEQVFIAETTTLVNRGFFAALPESIGGIVALFVGSIAAEAVLKHSTWRWGYGMWAIIVPLCACPLISIMSVLEYRASRARKAVDLHAQKPKREARDQIKSIFRFLWAELDILGAVLLAAGLALILIPISLTGSSHADRWHSASFIAMLVVGVVSLVAFGIWDGLFAKRPIVPMSMMKDRTVVAAYLVGALDFLSYSAFTDFFPSYLQVAATYTPSQASLVSYSLIIAYQATRIFTGILLRFTKRTQIWIFIGVPLCILGQGLMIHFTDMPGGHVANKAAFVTAKVLVGVGRGLYHTASLVAVQALVSEQELSVATSLFLALMTVGSAIGESIGGAVWRHTLITNLASFLPDSAKSESDAIFGSLTVAKGYAPGTAVRDAINHAYRRSMRLLAIVATCFMIPMLVLMLFIKPVNLEKMDNERREGTARPSARAQNLDAAASTDT